MSSLGPWARDLGPGAWSSKSQGLWRVHALGTACQPGLGIELELVFAAGAAVCVVPACVCLCLAVAGFVIPQTGSRALPGAAGTSRRVPAAARLTPPARSGSRRCRARVGGRQDFRVEAFHVVQFLWRDRRKMTMNHARCQDSCCPSAVPVLQPGIAVRECPVRSREQFAVGGLCVRSVRMSDRIHAPTGLVSPLPSFRGSLR